MSRDWSLFLQDMLEACEKVMRYVDDMSMEQFAQDEMVRDAVLRNLEIIGEAAKKVPDEVRARHPQIEWKAIAGLRDILAHAYFALDDATLWDVIEQEVPQLLKELRNMSREA